MATKHLWKVLENYEAQIALDKGVVVTRDGHEIDFFRDNKSAGSWVQHVYGMTPGEARVFGILIQPIDKRGPRQGDAVTYRGGGNGNWGYLAEKGERHGVLTHAYDGKSLDICFDASVFRAGDSFSMSGGPFPGKIPPESLAFMGFKPQLYWRWHAGHVGAGEGGYYSMNVPHWLWNGDSSDRVSPFDRTHP